MLKRIFKIIWGDVQKGENLDLYILIILSILLITATIIGVDAQKWYPPLVLTTLTIISVSLLINRYQNKEVLDAVRKQNSKPNKLPYMHIFPGKIRDDILKSRNLTIVGMSLSRTIIDYYAEFEQKLKRGDRIRILLMEPEGQSMDISLERSKRPVTREQAASDIRGTLSSLCALSLNKTSNLKKVDLEIRTIDHPVAFGAYAIDVQTSDGVVYWENYSYMMPVFDVPKLIITPNDEDWYKFINNQINVLWDSAKPWICTKE